MKSLIQPCRLWYCFVFFGLFFLASTKTGELKGQNWKLILPAYPTPDAIVAGLTAGDLGISGDGITDATSQIQLGINTLAQAGGGTLFLPAGKYVIKGTLLLKKGVVIRGELKKPVPGEPVEGTILMAYSGKGSEDGEAFITMEPSSGVMDMAFWYPEQIADLIMPYPPTILFGSPDVWGNDFVNVKNVLLVNSYSGLIYSRINGGACPVISGIYGTPLSRGIEIDNIADVGRLDWVDFSPAYWQGSALPGSPVKGSSIESWLYQNGKGLIIRRNDWSYTGFIRVSGYHTGFYAAMSIPSPPSVPNGHNYSLAFTNCYYGLHLEETEQVGIMFANLKAIRCNTAISVGSGNQGVIQIHSALLDSCANVLVIPPASTAKLVMQQCTINGGKIRVSGGQFLASDCDFNNSAPQIALGPNSRTILTGNRFLHPVEIDDNSIYENHINHQPLALPKLPAFFDTLTRTQKPTRMVLYLATGAPFYAKNDGETDNTLAIQSALNAAGSAGGGIVFLPPGKYKVLGNLTVPSNVELKGSVDLGSSPTGPGTVLEVYAGRGNPLADPFLTLSSQSGVRGIAFNYPEQIGDSFPHFPEYPYCIRGAGHDIYLVNVGFRAVDKGIDLFTQACNNHFVDYAAGHVFRNAIRVGGGTTGGKISNMQFNIAAYAFGQESKWGSWPNSPTQHGDVRIYDFGKTYLKFMILEDCSGQTLYNNFHYGSYQGIVLDGVSGISLGLGIDGSREAMVFNSLGGSFDFINSQVVSIDNMSGTSYILTNPGFAGQSTLFNSDYWGSPKTAVTLNGGAINLQAANFRNPGIETFAKLSLSNLHLQNSVVWPPNLLMESGDEPGLTVRASLIDSSGISTQAFGLWEYNLPNDLVQDPAKGINRSGWTASASHNNPIAYLAIDGNNESRWDTGIPQTPGQWFSINLNETRSFNRLIMDYTPSALDNPKQYSIFASADGINWGNAVATGSGIPLLTQVDFPMQTARHIRVTQDGSTDEKFWSIHEFYLILDTFHIRVTGVEISTESVTLERDSVFQLTALVIPVNASQKRTIWISSNPRVASVSNTGLVKALSPGVAVVTAISDDGEFKASSTVVVTGITGTDSNRNSDFEVYPNPGSGTLFVRFSSAFTRGAEIHLSDSRGTILQSTTLLPGAENHLYSLNIAGLSPGAYFLILKMNGKSTGRTIIIQP